MKQNEKNPNEECETQFFAASKERSNKNAKNATSYVTQCKDAEYRINRITLTSTMDYRNFVFFILLAWLV